MTPRMKPCIESVQFPDDPTRRVWFVDYDCKCGCGCWDTKDFDTWAEAVPFALHVAAGHDPEDYPT